jgi:hypothetical protein
MRVVVWVVHCVFLRRSGALGTGSSGHDEWFYDLVIGHGRTRSKASYDWAAF